MKRIIFFTLIILTAVIPGFSQGEMDALRYSQNELRGTARAVGMGGAFGALGGDITGIAINPAGIGVYTSSEFVTTLNFSNKGIETNLNAGKQKENKFAFSFDNLAFVGVLPVKNDVVPFINFGFSYNKLKNFRRTYTMQGNNQARSLTDLMANQATANKNLDFGGKGFDNDYEVWSSVLGYQSFLIDPVLDANNQLQGYVSVLPEGHRINNTLHVKEKGSIDSYDFNVGTTFSDMISVGLTVAVTDISYHIHSFYDEAFDNKYGFTLNNYLKTEGTGWQVKAGVIFKPVKELRIGVAYHSPTWYQMTNYFTSILNQDITGYSHDPDYSPGEIDSRYEGNTFYGDYTRDYDFRTPDKWTFSLAGIIGRNAIISVDYELTNYSKMKLEEPDSGMPYTDQNGYIKEDFRNASAIRIGAEYRFTPQFSGRVGYSWVQSPFKKEFIDANETGDTAPAMAGPISHYVIDGDTHYITYGLGYRFTPNFYTDIAFVMKNQKSDSYAFGGADKATFKDNTFSGLLTLGYRF